MECGVMKITSKKIMGTHRYSQREKTHKAGSPPVVQCSGEDGVTMKFEMDGHLFRVDLNFSEAGRLVGGLAWGVEAGVKLFLEAQEKRKKEGS